MKISLDAVEINQVKEAITIAEGIGKLNEAKQLIGQPGLVAILHVQSSQSQPLSIEINEELLEAVVQFMFNREVTTLNRMGVDLKD